MLDYLRKAVTGAQVKDNSRNNLVRDEFQKKKIKEYLAGVIKQLQKAYIQSEECIIERNDEDAQNLCTGLEAVFLHGLLYHGSGLHAGASLRSMFSEGIMRSADEVDDHIAQMEFWNIVKEVTHGDVITQLKHLVVTTDVGLSRAWVRLALNDGLMVSYIDAILADILHLRRNYSSNAFLMDNELPMILKELLQGLENFQFRLNYNSSKLNSWDILPLQLAGLIQQTEISKSLDSTDGTFFPRNVTEKWKDIQTKRDNTDSSVSLEKYNALKTAYRAEDETSSGSVSIPVSPVRANPGAFTNDASTRQINSSPKSDAIRRLTEDSQHGSSETSISLSVSTESTSPPSKHANLENSPSTKLLKKDDELLEYSPMTQQRMLGNRLGGQGLWEGWSSSFETDPTEHIPPTIIENKTTEDEKVKSFGTLLQTYGNNSGVENAESLFDSSTYDLDKSVTQNTSENKLQNESEISSPTASDPNLVKMNFEVVPSNMSTHGQFVDQKTQMSLDQLTNIGCEQGLDKQNFQCKQCGKPIGLIYGPYRVCYYDGGYYCSECHDDEEHLIPGRVVQNWEFKKYKVSKYNKIFLMKIEEEPLFHIDEVNPTLYDVILDLKEVKVLRIQLQYIKGYIHTCRLEVAEDFRRRLWPREYLAEDVHQYSLLDLVQVYNGQLAHHLRKVIQQFTKHIFKCNLCCQKGFICEYCNDENIIYPFQVNIAVQCPGCLSVFHKKCRQDKRCPKCVRIHLRLQNKNDIDQKLSVTQKEQYIGRDIL